MASENRLHRRDNGRFYLKAWVPKDVRHVIPGGRSGGKWIALGTSDYAEASRLIRVKSVEFDQEIELARRRLRGEQDELSQAEADRLAAIWLSNALEEDEEARAEGLDDRAFNRAEETGDHLALGAGAALARGDASSLTFEIEDLLSTHGLHVQQGSPGWQRISLAMLKAQKRLGTALQQRNQGEVVDTPPLPTAADAKRSCTVNDLIDLYVADPSKKRTPGTMKTYNTVFRAMRELFGPDTPANSIHRTDCERVRDVLLRVPKNATQRFPDMTLEEAAAEAKRQGLPTLGDKVVNNYLNNFSSVFKFGVKSWRIDRNPAEGLSIAVDEDADGEGRGTFSVQQLNVIFNAPLYRGCIDDEDGYAKPGPHVIRRGRFWIPLISLWSGMRLNECCQLVTADIQQYEGVPVILITDAANGGDEDEADRKRIKTKAGKRFVPVHPELQRIGFLDYVKEMKAAKSQRLFPELKPGKQTGYLSDPFSKWFNDKRRFLGKLGLAGQVPHSTVSVTLTGTHCAKPT
ncbi:site-specific integrase [Bradyrhizobium sp. 180]|uniref:site-specific integrase n=1 Tax=Bradyrhizobium sp. 180 TaxID=2782650 RepID=UPI001FF85E91|nr:site-specific integrase [Bradyrhizobium sp. 180]MCK1491305.1 site-specific integrase [Bradyrhizobium sp. 180]